MMKRPLFLTGLCFFAAALAAVCMGASMAFAVGALCVLWAVLACVLYDRRRIQLLLTLLLSTALACLLTAGFFSLRLSPLTLPTDTVFPAKGTVLSVSSQEKGSLVEAQVQTSLLPEKIRLRLFLPDDTEPQAGWRFYGVLRVRESYGETGENWRLSKGEFLFCVPDSPLLFDQEPSDLTLFEQMMVLRQRMLDACGELAWGDTAALLKGILLGETDGFSDEFSDALDNSGLRHFTAVSGLHISLMTGFVFALGRALYCSPVRTAWIVLAALPPLAFLEGMTPSVMRACLMCGIAAAARLTHRQYDALSALGLAAVVILLFNPLAAVSISFQLTFGAMLGICLLEDCFAVRLLELPALGRFNERKNRLRKPLLAGVNILAASLAVQVVTLPIQLFHFGRFPVLGAFSALFIAPVFPLMLLGGLLAVLLQLLLPALPLGDWVFMAVQPLYDWFVVTAKAFAVLPVLTVRPGQTYFWALLGMFYLGGWLIRKERRLHLPAVIAVVGLLLCGEYAWRSADRELLHIIRIEDNTVLLAQNGKGILAGDLPDEYSAAMVMRAMERNGIDSLEWAAITSHDTENSYGMVVLCEEYPPQNILAPYGGRYAPFLVKAGGQKLHLLAEPTTLSLGENASLTLIPHMGEQTEIQIRAAGKNLLKSTDEYAIIKNKPLADTVYLSQDGGFYPEYGQGFALLKDTNPHLIIRTGGEAD